MHQFSIDGIASDCKMSANGKTASVPIRFVSTQGFTPTKCAAKCAVRFESVCANVDFFGTLARCFRAGLVLGKCLILNGDYGPRNDNPSLPLNQHKDFHGKCYRKLCASPLGQCRSSGHKGLRKV
jgi:hypothetical protein